MPLLLMLWLSSSVVVPKNVILVKGATPSASDAVTPVPEQGSVAGGRYRNAYFGLSYPIPAGWTRQPEGPPPSDSGSYVLALFAAPRAHVQLTAQDLFFGPAARTDAKAVIGAARKALPPQYEVDGEPSEVSIGGRTFQRLSYTAPRSGLHWRIFATDARCHALAFTFTGTDAAALDAAVAALNGLTLPKPGAVPACVAGYARAENLVEKSDPVFTTHRFNTIPVRVIAGRDGRIKHVHVLSAFPEQSQAILEALRGWRLEPYRVNGKAVDLETGIVFGMLRPRG